MKVNSKIIFIILIAAAITAAICFLFWPKYNKQETVFDLSTVQEKKYIQLLFVGDLMFDRGVRIHAEKNGGNEFIFEKITPILLANDLVIANLEGPITDAKSMSVTAGPTQPESITFTFDPSLAKTLFNQNIRLVNLGNNHILNFGKSGVESTEKYLDQENIEYFGAPQTKRSVIKDINGIRVAFVSYNYYEFRGDLGKAEKATIDEIKEVRPVVDVVVMFCHWGDEYKLKNNEAQEILARKFIDQGADLIIGSHPHVIQNIEEYKNKRIYYSLGNFIFDQYFNEDVRNGLGVVVKINKKTKQMDFSEKHFYIEKTGQTVEKIP